jgi:hypothetical protein
MTAGYDLSFQRCSVRHNDVTRRTITDHQAPPARGKVQGDQKADAGVQSVLISLERQSLPGYLLQPSNDSNEMMLVH